MRVGGARVVRVDQDRQPRRLLVLRHPSAPARNSSAQHDASRAGSRWPPGRSEDVRSEDLRSEDLRSEDLRSEDPAFAAGAEAGRVSRPAAVWVMPDARVDAHTRPENNSFNTDT